MTFNSLLLKLILKKILAKETSEIINFIFIIKFFLLFEKIPV